MKNTIFKCGNGDITNIHTDLNNAEFVVCPSEGNEVEVIMPASANIHAAVSGTELIITQTKRSRIFKKQRIKVSVPQCAVPDCTVFGKRPKLYFYDCILGELTVNAACDGIYAERCSFSEISVNAACDVYISETTVKGNAYILSERGDALVENSFFNRAEVRLKKGNLGLIDMNCRENILETLNGNISATFAAAENGYSTDVKAKGGVCNRESAQKDNARGYIKAYACGNISLDFAKEEETPREEAAISESEEEANTGKEAI